MRLAPLFCTTLPLLLVAGLLAGCGSPTAVSEGGTSTPAIEPTTPPKATSTTAPTDTPPTASAPNDNPGRTDGHNLTGHPGRHCNCSPARGH